MAVRSTSCEAPVERPRRSVVALFETLESVLEGGQIGEIARLDHLALDDREHVLDLVQPRGVDRQMNEVSVGSRSAHPVDRALPVVRRSGQTHPLSTIQYGTVALTDRVLAARVSR